MSLSSPSTRRKLLLDSDEAPEDDQPNAWTCSYVMSSGDGVNLLGTLDVDRNRARFVANSGLFGTAYQFVMPRDQIQIVRVPTASSPYNALELHTKYRQNILCDFDDNVATFKRCCEVMKLDVLPQDEPLIAVLPTDVSDHANKWRARAAQKRREREAAEAQALARGGGEPDDGHQLTQQVMHLHGEKVALQRRMVELERENEHLHGEVEVLYAQVDEQSERSQRQREALEAAAREALDDVLAADMEKERTRRIEAAREKEKLLPEASQREEGEKENKAVTPPDSALKKAEQGHCVAEVSEAEKLKNAQRQDELVASVASLREERAMFEGEVARLRLELERRDAEREEKLANADANDANAENAENKASSSLDAEERDDDMQDMLAMEVQRLLAKQAELSSHLARAQREKEMLEKENELLYQQTEAVEEDAQTARFERALAWERLSEAESAAGFRVLETAIAPSSPPRDNEVVSPSVSSRASPIKAGGPPIKGSALPKIEKASDGPDAELAAKLIGRLERGGESDEAASLKLEMERMKAELGRMKAERAESLGRSRVGSDAASETKPSEEDENARRSGEDTGDSASAAAAAELRAALEKKEEELRIERRRVAKEIAAATKRAAAEASAREKEEALWRVTEAELRAADAERALEALRVEKEESERALALATEELRSERSRSRAGSVSASLSLSQAGDRTRDSQNDGSRVSLPFGVPLPDPPGFGTEDRTSSDGGWSVPERVWQEILLEKESALSALSASDKAKEDEIERLRERLSKLERRAKKEASTHEGSTPSPPKRSVSRSVKSSPATAFNETLAGVGKLPAIDVSGKSVTRSDSPTAKATSPEYAKSPRSPFAKGLTGLGVAAAGFVFGKLSPQ